MTTVAIVGTGRMGSGMAHALAAAGHRVVLQNRTRDRAEALAAEIDATVVATPAEAAATADVTITMLADDDAVAAVYTGRDGLVEGARAGTVLVDSSTVRPDTIRAVEAPVRATGAGLLDAPVSGSTAFARTGSLTLMVGGEASDLERARPGAPYLGYKRAAFLDPGGTPVAFALELAEKDLRLITELAAALGVEVPQAAANLELIRQASTEGRATQDFSTVAEELRARRTGAPVA